MLKTGHFLGVAASWIVQIGIEIYRSISRIMKSGEESDDKVESQEAKLLGKKVFGVTIRCGSSLVFASIGAGIGATIVRPSIGQWIGKKIARFLLAIISNNLHKLAFFFRLCCW